MVKSDDENYENEVNEDEIENNIVGLMRKNKKQKVNIFFTILLTLIEKYLGN